MIACPSPQRTGSYLAFIPSDLPHRQVVEVTRFLDIGPRVLLLPSEPPETPATQSLLAFLTLLFQPRKAKNQIWVHFWVHVRSLGKGRARGLTPPSPPDRRHRARSRTGGGWSDQIAQHNPVERLRSTGPLPPHRQARRQHRASRSSAVQASNPGFRVTFNHGV